MHVSIFSLFPFLSEINKNMYFSKVPQKSKPVSVALLLLNPPLALYVYLALQNLHRFMYSINSAVNVYCILSPVLNYSPKKGILIENDWNQAHDSGKEWSKFQINLRMYMFVPNLYTSCVHISYYVWGFPCIRFAPCFTSSVFSKSKNTKNQKKISYLFSSKYLPDEDTKNFYRNCKLIIYFTLFRSFC